MRRDVTCSKREGGSAGGSYGLVRAASGFLQKLTVARKFPGNVELLEENAQGKEENVGMRLLIP